jgi:PqqD family protein of HPr-rel-A system
VPDSRWVCTRGADYSLQHWPDSSILFDEANGSLHRLNSAAGRMMALFLQKPDWTSSELVRALFGDDIHSEDLDSVVAALENFVTLNLIERSPD